MKIAELQSVIWVPTSPGASVRQVFSLIALKPISRSLPRRPVAQSRGVPVLRLLGHCQTAARGHPHCLSGTVRAWSLESTTNVASMRAGFCMLAFSLMRCFAPGTS